MRKAGVLLPVSSLMGEYGIGDFGKSARYFVDFIGRIGFKLWQILPITVLGAGNSPYSGVSAFAGNFLLLDVSALEGSLLMRGEIEDAKYCNPYKIDYAFVRKRKKDLLEVAYSRLDGDYINKVNAFAGQNGYWLPDYALYMALREENGEKEWGEWSPALKFREEGALAAARERLKDRITYYYFEQYLFYSQWSELKAYANSRGVEIVGDMPIYVAYNSPDVWASPGNFLLDNDLKPQKVAGVPPDYFAAEGQLWGNPLYNYAAMEKDGYKWLVGRIKHNLNLYDILRIDHFRGLCEYWAVPATATTAKEGKWQEGPGMKLWRALGKEVKEPKIIAEDLGIIDDKVRAFLKESGFPGMRVLQFAFDGTADNPNLPYNYEKNTVAYTATHDNDTTLGWLYSLDSSARSAVLNYIGVSEHYWGAGGRGCISTKAFCKEVLASVADTAIIPLQDLCGYGGDTRLNVPGVAEGNWQYRASLSALDDVDIDYYRDLLFKYGRR